MIDEKASRLAVVICTYNRSDSLIETLTSLYADGYAGPVPIDILVIANNCSDDTLVQLMAFRSGYPQDLLKLNWQIEPRPGKSYALNTAIANTDHDVLCFIDDDQIIESGFLQHLMEGIIQYSDEDIFCGRIWPAWDGSEPSWVHAKEPYAIPIRPFPEFDLGSISIRLGPNARFPSGGNISVRRRVFDAVGNFVIELGPSGHNLVGGEDHDFLRRATNQGYTIRYLPKVRQLHAIDSHRMSTFYTLRKSFFRSRASFLIRAPEKKPRPYMFRKILSHLGNAVFSFNSDRRFFYLVRLTASSGELAGAFKLYRTSSIISEQRSSLKSEQRMALAGICISFLAVSFSLAWFLNGDLSMPGLFSAFAVAGGGALLLLTKSLSDFSQTGPRIRKEVLTHYRRYTLFALIRLSIWAFALMLFMSGGGVLIYYALNVSLGETWSAWLAALAAALGIVGASILQFIRKLRFNPGLLVASLHYRISRFYPLWQWATPTRIHLVQIILGLAVALLVTVASWRLIAQNQMTDLVALWAAVLFYGGVILCVGWLPKARAPRRRPSRPSNAPPNILMIGSDTLRADRLGALGYRRALTPHIDALAAQGALFANCYVPCARTAPSLVSLLTGTWPHTHGIRDNYVPDQETRLKVPALPQLLKPLGYRTAVLSDWCGADMGKFSFGFDYTDLPEDQWNLKYLIRQGPKDLRLFISLFTHNRLGRLLLPELYYLGGVPLTTQLGCRARQLISRLAADSQPFFLNVFYSTTHPPFASEWPWYTRFADTAYEGESKFAMARLTDPFEIIRRQGAPKAEFDLDQIIDLYDGCVAQFDDEVGRILRHVDACGLTDNTIIVVYSDHGMEFFEHETWGQGNSAVGDFSSRVPLVIRDPHKPARGIIDQVVRSIDLTPTLLDLAGSAPTVSMDGVSLAACLNRHGTCPQLDVFNETGVWIADIPGLPEKHLRYPDLLELMEVPDNETGTLALKGQYQDIILRAKDRMIRRGPWKLVCQPLTDGYRLMLFNVVEDPGCTQDYAAAYPHIRDQLYQALQAWMSAKEKTSTCERKISAL